MKLNALGLGAALAFLAFAPAAQAGCNATCRAKCEDACRRGTCSNGVAGCIAKWSKRSETMTPAQLRALERKLRARSESK